MEKEYPIGCYAPGNYQCKCISCKDVFIGDKRAVQCEPCALKIVNQAQEIMTAAEKHIKKELGLTDRDIEYRPDFSYPVTLGLMESYHKESSKELVEVLKSDSVYTLLRFGFKSPSKSGVDDCDDKKYLDLYKLVCELRKH